MKKASQILLLVGMILSFVWAASYFCAGVAFVVGGAVGGTNLPKILAYFGIDLSEYGLTPEQLQAFTYAFMFTMGGFFILWSGFAIANGVIAYLGRQKQNKTFYIINIIFQWNNSI